MSELKKTPLYDIHRELGAKLVEFAGFEMPVQYEGLIKEHKGVRDRVGIFDVSHMGEIEVTGPKALEYCQLITTNDVSKLDIGSVQYSCYCMEHGGVVDDFTLFKTGSDKYLFIVNASNKDKDHAWMLKNRINGASIRDLSDEYSLLALQGPLSEEVLSKIFPDDLSLIKFYGFIKTSFQGSEVMLSRTGYTGEDGFEIMVENDKAALLWKAIESKGKPSGIVPVGLGARDTLRMEMGYALYGHELSDKISPLEANLGWIVKLKKGDFIGRKALVEQKEKGINRKLKGFKLKERGVPRENFRLFVKEREVGYVSSGTYSPSLEIGFGLCFVDKDLDFGDEVSVDIRGKRIAAELAKPPFVSGSVKK